MNTAESSSVPRLTKYSHGAGCGCKIAPQVLSEILQQNEIPIRDPLLLAGNEGNEDAAVYNLENGSALISTTDFFMPIVDDAFDFGRIAAANAISDVYAMGGTPKLALAILGWPVNKLSPALASEVMRGARQICREAGISLAGGHSIDSPEPIFGLSVNGLVQLEHLKRNNTAREGDLIFLSKAIGVGLLTTAMKKDQLAEEHLPALIAQLTQLNSLGEKLGRVSGVSAMTDVTGFSLMGHALEMAEGSKLSAELEYGKIPVLEAARQLVPKGLFPDATYRNWNAYSPKTKLSETINASEAFALLSDPQTNGGLLFTADPRAIAEVQELLRETGLEAFCEPIGRILPQAEKALLIR
ncbi:MAG TPA: selenide, water dikinase SelD [Bacteroidia bacterium]|nr:selenide, water dikinase SelD [Bacteroidia bacterium]